jgi:hypothetical protein
VAHLWRPSLFTPFFDHCWLVSTHTGRSALLAGGKQEQRMNQLVELAERLQQYKLLALFAKEAL